MVNDDRLADTDGRQLYLVLKSCGMLESFAQCFLHLHVMRDLTGEDLVKYFLHRRNATHKGVAYLGLHELRLEEVASKIKKLPWRHIHDIVMRKNFYCDVYEREN